MINISRRTAVRIVVAGLAAGLALPLILLAGYRRPNGIRRSSRVSVENGRILLPLPRLAGETSLEEALGNRRSIREYLDEPLSIGELAQLLWAAYGVSETAQGFKTSPSAGATYPLTIYAVAKHRGVSMPRGFLAPGSYRYDPRTHSLEIVVEGDLTGKLYEAGLRQDWIKKAPVNLVITAIYERTTTYYGSRGTRYVHMEAGHAGQNIYLQATALGLATVAVGAFHDELIARTIGATPSEKPLYIMPVGKPVEKHRLTPSKLADYIAGNRR